MTTTKKHEASPPPHTSSPPQQRQEEAPLPPRITTREEALCLVERSYTVNLLMMTLHHGATFAPRSFAAHAGLMNLLKRAYEERSEERFVGVLSDYLQQAQGRVAQVPAQAQVPGILDEVRRLIAAAGLVPVARRLLSVQQMPVSRPGGGSVF